MIANLAGDEFVEVRNKVLKEVMSENQQLEKKIQSLTTTLEQRNSEYDCLVATGKELQSKLKNLRRDHDIENHDRSSSGNANLDKSGLEDEFDFNFSDSGSSKLEFISQKVVKSGLKDIAECLKDLSQFSEEILVRPIHNDEDFKNLTANIRRMIDSLMVKENTVQKRELTVEKNITRMKLLEKEVNNLRKRTEILTGATQIFAHG